ncbi:MAG: serine/threonine-protein kinase, partial [Phycisphaerae bacterium]
MANCLTQRDFERYDSGELALAESDAMRGHLSACGACRTAHKQHRERIARESYAPRTPTDVTQSITPEKRHTAASASRRGDKTVPNIDGYKIMGVLGQGGMGIVYRAIQVKLNRTVALKVLPAMVGSASTSAVTRFRREATSAARLHHTHIIPVYDFGESPDGYYYAMELITGHPLDTLIRRFDEQDATSAALGRLGKILRSTVPEAVTTHSTDGTAVSSSADLSVTTTASAPGRHTAYYKYVARWMADAADALHYAHGQGIMHRDIKPANLILSTHGRIMVADFGLAKSSDSETVTQTGSLLGTLRYMSPEQAMARRVRVDYRTDVYSLGATMYELLCFKPAFPGDDDKAILGDIISRDPVRPRKLTPACPPELDTICMKCLEKSPAGRYDSAKALEDDLLRFINDLPIAARRPGAVRRTGKLIRRHKAASVAVGAIFLLCGVAALAVHFNHQRREAAAAGQRQKLAALRQEKLAVQAEAHEIVMQGIQVFQSPTATPAATVAKLERACKYYHAALERVPSQWRALGELARAKKELYNYQTDPDPALLDEAYALCGQALALKPR